MAKYRSREAREIIKYAESLGYELARDHKHLVFRLPETGVTVTTSGSPSDNRAVENAKADLRRYARRAGVA